jgi:hypothetical protein
MFDLSLRRVFPLFLAAATLPATLLATPIFVANHSFETSYALDSGCGFNCFFNQSGAPSWTSPIVPGVGTWNPGPSLGNFSHFNVIPDGALLGYSNGPNASLSQVVSPTVVAGITYTLMVEVGNRKAYALDLPVVELVIGSTSYLATGTLGAEGAFSTFTATYTGTTADVGKTIMVRLSGGAGGQGNFDNVRLADSAGPVPEPATYATLASALALIGWRLRRRSSSRLNA